MGRVKDFITVNGHKWRTLFDSGSRNTYIVPKAAKGNLRKKLQQVFEVRLGGKLHRLRECVIFEGKIKTKSIATDAFVIDEIGRDEQGKPIEVLFGALAMQQWGIELDLRRERLDLTHYSKEFLEF